MAEPVSHWGKALSFCEAGWLVISKASRTNPPGDHSSAAWDLPTRKLDPVLWIKFVQLAAYVSGNQIIHFRAQHPCENVKLQIGNAALLVFQTRYRLAAGIPAESHADYYRLPHPQNSETIFRRERGIKKDGVRFGMRGRFL